MSWDIFISQVFGILLLPPSINILLIISGLLMIKKYPRISKSFLILSTVSLWLMSTHWFSNKMIHLVETEPAISLTQVKNYQVDPYDSAEQSDLSELFDSHENIAKRAIVVLAGGRILLAEEYGNVDVVSSYSLQRIKYASWLHKKTNLPILLSGGSVFNEATAEAVLMNQAILSDFSVAPQWVESQSKNTAENALYSNKILSASGISEILLVTHAWHMPRAKRMFEEQGLKVISAPTVFLSHAGCASCITDYLPSARALNKTNLAFHELLGGLWYKLRY